MSEHPTSDFWDALGLAAIILACCIGFGGCGYLWSKGDALEAAAKHGQVIKP